MLFPGTVNASLSGSLSNKHHLVLGSVAAALALGKGGAAHKPVYSPLLQVGLVVSVFAVFPNQLVGVGLVGGVLGHQGNANTKRAAVVVHLRRPHVLPEQALSAKLRYGAWPQAHLDGRVCFGGVVALLPGDAPG